MIKLDFGNRTYWQFCPGDQFEAAQTFWVEEEGIKMLYQENRDQESISALKQRLLTTEKDYMVPGGDSFSSGWRKQCMARKLQVEDDVRMEKRRQGQAKKTKHTDHANAAAAKRREEMAGAAEKRANNGQHNGTDHNKSEEYLKWKDFIFTVWHADATSAAAQEDGVEEEQPHPVEEEEKKEVSASEFVFSFIPTTTSNYSLSVPTQG